MKTIGIKLADGTFYPILEEGTSKKRMLDLTTAKDNQTKVQIDLYRSEDGSMEDAEYVDTLEITKLNPHPNGEPELHLSVGLDDEGHLTAEVVDPETGKKSETEVTLVSRTEAERASPADFAVTGTSEETTFSPDDLPDIKSDALEDMPFSFDHSEPSSAESSSSASADTDSFSGALPDFSDLDNDIPVEDTTLESIDFSHDAFADSSDDDVIGTESPTLADDAVQTDTTTILDTPDEPAESPADTFTTDEFSLPDFDSIDTGSDDPFASTDSTSDTLADSTFDVPETSSLPDFDSDSISTDFSSDDSSTSASGFNFDDLDDPAFSASEFDSTLDSLNSEPEDKFFDTAASASTGSTMDFSDLYDKETLAGEHASLYDEEEEHKKTRVPVIICIICAIICVIATILVLFIVPSKYNLIASRNTNGISILDRFFSKEKETAIEQPAETAAPLPEPEKEEPPVIEVIVEEPKDVPAPSAEEDKIVIAPEPEKVVPEPAPVVEEKPEVKKSADVNYHIKWGDTLWDISDSYYKTPWKYPKIATYNKIRNPDLIIAGTDILIPAE